MILRFGHLSKTQEKEKVKDQGLMFTCKIAQEK